MFDINFLNDKKILITGGAGFIGGTLIRRLLKYSNCNVINIDKLNYASDLTSINYLINKTKGLEKRYAFFKIDIADSLKLEEIFNLTNPDLIINFAAESHVDRSINNPYCFIESNIIGTFNLLNIALKYWQNLSNIKKKLFKFHHVSTDEVFGSLDLDGKFNENTPYAPNSPYSASKASSDHLVRAWFRTYGLPTLITNCGNNYGPWQFPEKLIPLTIQKAFLQKNIPIYGNGENIRDWLHVEDHIDAIIKVLEKGEAGSSYCIGGCSEKKNIDIVKLICLYMDEILPQKNSYINLIKFVDDRPGHDLRYAIDYSKIQKELSWEPKYSFNEGLRDTINWYLENEYWLLKNS